jgi:tRNA pseudouridine38-40 synthase
LPRYLLTLEYVGTDFHGFQRQPGMGTIQGALEQAITAFTGREVRVQGSGRTDTGVHALGQAAAFDIGDRLDVGKASASLNALLPAGISVTGMARVGEGLDPRRDALWREYRYFILNRKAPSPVLDPYSHHVSGALDREAMSRACDALVGEHDFSAFRVKGGSEDSKVRIVIASDMTEPFADLLCIRVRATAFLYRMVRIIAGAVKDVGCGRMDLEALSGHLAGAARPCADPLPAQGLFLWQVAYPEGTFVVERGANPA